MPTIASYFKPIPPQRQAGLSLIELMISLTIGMILLVGIASLILQQNTTRDELEKSSRQIENGRYAVQILHDDIEHAGFFGAFNPPAFSPVAPTDPCITTLGGTSSGWDNAASSPTAIFGYYQPVTGASADPTTATTCGLTNYKPNTSILVVRRTATVPASAVAGIPYLQVSGCNSEATNTPYFYSVGTPGTILHTKDCTSPAAILPYMVNVYYISSCDAVSSTGVCMDAIPTLKMLQAGAPMPPSTTPPSSITPVIIPLAEGIENMQFDYGLDTDIPGDGYPDTYASAVPVTSQNNWPNVMTIRINILARNTDCSTGYQNNKTYYMSGAASGVPAMLAGPFNDAALCNGSNNNGFKRHLFTELVRVVNPSARRALQ